MVAAAVAALLRGCNGSEDQALGTTYRAAAQLSWIRWSRASLTCYLCGSLSEMATPLLN